MRRLAARREHVLVSDPVVADFLSAALRGRPAAERLFPGGGAELREAFAGVLGGLGVPTGDVAGLTLASLRAGGATWFYEETRDLGLVRWRGRWGAPRTLEVYIQEVGALHVLADVGPQARARIERFAEALPHLMATPAPPPN